MQVVDRKQLLLSNLEVLQLLREVDRKIRCKSGRKRSGNLATIVYETIKYLEDSPASTLASAGSDGGNNAVRELLTRLKSVNLAKSEKLDIVNHLPSSFLELQLLIEENEERFTEGEELNQILDIISTVIPESREEKAEADIPEAEDEEETTSQDIPVTHRVKEEEMDTS